MLFEHGQLCLHVPKLLVVCGVSLVVFAFSVPTHYKNRFFWGFWKLDFQFFCQKSRVNNLATIGSITWPHFCPHFFGGHVARLLTLQFSFNSFWKLCFFQQSHSPCRKKNIFEEQQKGNETKVARLLILQALNCGQVIDFTAYIYVYIYIFFIITHWYMFMYFWL